MITISTFHAASTSVVLPTVARAGAWPVGIQAVQASFINEASEMSRRKICGRKNEWNLSHTAFVNDV